MRVTRSEQSQGGDGRDVYRLFVEPELQRDIANNGPVSRLMSNAFGLGRNPSRRG